ncbi:NFACT family protein [Roseburia sp. NSJ-9]|uniref:Rqc2 homolog RqcH n=1 Tax=Roseburia lenta TaxID=2763061 RepID=A0ABR7GEH3_9FIRM|nr:NFACT RNA binding domain-containing protein [Roseburia lenta]MBC5685186.1 NFACT family protein [Roseburia lenta]
MAFDGITTNCIMQELNHLLAGQRISKIAQPEREELLFTFKALNEGSNRLLISANASLPFLYMTKENKTSPLNAPNFCMLLRKYIGNGRISAISQPSMERVLCFTIEHLDEMGDPAVKYLYVEIMGKHSNIIFCDKDGQIIDSIKHVSGQMSSIREVLPGRPYFIPAQQDRFDPWQIAKEQFVEQILKKPCSVTKAIYTSLVGFSPFIATELAYRSGLDADDSTAALTQADVERLYDVFRSLLQDLSDGNFSYGIYYDPVTGAPKEFAPIPLTIYSDMEYKTFSSISEVLEAFYAQRNKHTVIHQKSTDLRKIVSIHLERDRKKYLLQKKQLADTEKKDKYRIYGEMLHTYGYAASPGDKSIEVTNYYTNEPFVIPLDPTLDAMENAKKYFDKYAKLKRTGNALSSYILETENEIKHLESIETSLSIAETEGDLAAIKEELQEYGFIKKHSGKKTNRISKSQPLHFVDDNGFHIYVGKNNYQNDQLTFKFATGNDWWFHAKQMTGSHVIVKSENKELPDSTYEYAAALAAYYSSGRDNEKVEIDYLQKKNVKKPNGSAPGFVVYYTNYSLVATPSLAHVTLVSDK